MKWIITSIVLAALTAALSLSYKLGENESKVWYQSELGRINAESASLKKSSEESINGIETQRIKDKEAADERIKQLAKRQRPVVTGCTTSASGVVSAGISDGAVRLLRETADDNRIPKASDTSGPTPSP